MTDKEFFAKTVADETPRFERVLRALPQDKLDWKPDPKSRTAMELASTIAGESMMFPVILKTGTVDVAAEQGSFKTADEMVGAMKQALGEAQAVAAGMTDADWASDAVMMMGGKEGWKTTKGGMALGFLLDLIHHRGQLSTYIRPMGGKVPSIYGPSADAAE